MSRTKANAINPYSDRIKTVSSGDSKIMFEETSDFNPNSMLEEEHLVDPDIVYTMEILDYEKVYSPLHLNAINYEKLSDETTNIEVEVEFQKYKEGLDFLLLSRDILNSKKQFDFKLSSHNRSINFDNLLPSAVDSKMSSADHKIIVTIKGVSTIKE